MNLKRILEKALCCVLTLIIMVSAISQIKLTVTALNITNPVTVKMTSLGSAIKSIAITVNDSYIINENNQSLQTNSIYTISAQGSGLTISSGGNLLYTFDASFFLSKQDSGTSGIKIHNSYYDSYYDGRDLVYLGNMKFANVGGYVVVYNYIDLETYLYGVVSQEMSDSYKIEALKAQAIAARTYVYNKAFVVTDDTNSQAYIGYNANYTNTINAVNETKGMVLSYLDTATNRYNIIQAFYSASNGGYTETPYDYYGSTDSFPYYQVERDDYDYVSTNLNYVHTFRFPKNVNSTTPLDAKISSLLSSPIESALSTLGYVHSSSYTINQFTKIVTNTPPNNRYASNSPVHSIATVTMNLSVTNNSGGLDNKSVTVNMKLYSLSAAFGFVDSHTYEEGSDTSYLTITGRGVFHSIGLSQLGAQQRAVEGINYHDILSFYYVGTSIATIDWSNTLYPTIWNGATNGRVNMRSGPSTSYSILSTLNVGTHLQILQAYSETDGTWYRVHLDSSQDDGYIRGDYIMLGDKPVLLMNIMVTPPTKTTYFAGQDIDLTGVKITANYDNITSQDIAVTSDIISGYNKNITGNQTITITYNGKTASFNVTVNPLIMTAAVNSSVIINRTKNRISNITPKTSVSVFLSLLNSNGGTFKMLDALGQPISSGNVGTGSRVQLLNPQMQVVDEQMVIIYGDMNGDGDINLSDLVMIRGYLTGVQTMDIPSKSAGDLYGEGDITLNDLVGIMAYVCDAGGINQNP
jgi:SpoIID/LytB domain protein